MTIESYILKPKVPRPFKTNQPCVKRLSLPQRSQSDIYQGPVSRDQQHLEENPKYVFHSHSNTHTNEPQVIQHAKPVSLDE